MRIRWLGHVLVVLAVSGCFGFRQVPNSQLPQAVEVGKRYRVNTKKRVYDLRISANNDKYLSGIREGSKKSKDAPDRPVRIRWRDVQSVEARRLRLVPTAAAGAVVAVAAVSVILALTGGSWPVCVSTSGLAPPPPGQPPSRPGP